MFKSTQTAKSGKPEKPRPDFPLFPHANGYWAKKIRQKLYYFGKIANDPDGEAALNLYLDQKDDLYAGRVPRANRDGLSVQDLVNRFLDAKESQVDTGEITKRTWTDYHVACARLIDAFGKRRLVDDLASDDFEGLRSAIAKTRAVTSLGNEIQRVRVVFSYAYQSGLIDKPMRYGPTFKRPSKRILRQHRQKSGPKMFEREQLATLLAAAPLQLKAMILLGVNCGFGNHDCGTLPISALDLKKGWVTFPRPKTAIERRCPLWPETVEALNAVLAKRKEPDSQDDAHLVFITKYGGRWSNGTQSNPISKEMRVLIQRVDDAAAEAATEKRKKPPTPIYRKGLGFYALRHTFETIGGESRDQVAVDHIMGHARDDMASLYRERISDDRLKAVTDSVRAWLWPPGKNKPSNVSTKTGQSENG